MMVDRQPNSVKHGVVSAHPHCPAVRRRPRSLRSRLVPETVRQRNTEATRSRIAETALGLFVRQGYAATTIDQIAERAGVARRTIFRHFEGKKAILFDQLVVRRAVAEQRLRERPASEPPLQSLYTVLRELCIEGYDRDLLAQIRAVLATEPRLAGEELAAGSRAATNQLIDALQSHSADDHTFAELHAVTVMAVGWLSSAAHIFLTEDRASLVDCFDEVVSVCVESAVRDLDQLAPSRIT
jgi:AcrR family transcriptional regulator